MTDVWVKATEYGDRNGVTLVRYASIGGMELDAWVASNDVTPRADGAAPTGALRAACEMALSHLTQIYAYSSMEQREHLVNTLRVALAATEPAPEPPIEIGDHVRFEGTVIQVKRDGITGEILITTDTPSGEEGYFAPEDVTIVSRPAETCGRCR